MVAVACGGGFAMALTAGGELLAITSAEVALEMSAYQGVAVGYVELSLANRLKDETHKTSTLLCQPVRVNEATRTGSPCQFGTLF